MRAKDVTMTRDGTVMLAAVVVVATVSRKKKTAKDSLAERVYL